MYKNLPANPRAGVEFFTSPSPAPAAARARLDVRVPGGALEAGLQGAGRGAGAAPERPGERAHLGAVLVRGLVLLPAARGAAQAAALPAHSGPRLTPR
ncbi:hypothetical protein ON010_g16528 [Phytophthora cinnamomi]|nr:hypothetical protein ON010_g16528 [Phytophthora cinnamomi]